MNYNVRRFRQHLFCAIRDSHVPRSIRRPGDFPQVLADLGGIRVNRADDLDGLFVTHQACDGSADRPDTVLDGPNLLLHVDLRSASGWRVRGFPERASPVAGRSTPKRVNYHKRVFPAVQSDSAPPLQPAALAGSRRNPDNVANAKQQTPAAWKRCGAARTGGRNATMRAEKLSGQGIASRRKSLSGWTI